MEYNNILEEASQIKDDAQRMAYMGVYAAVRFTNFERNPSKPFNPLCGETYEYVTDDFKFLAEQCSHHPPITAMYCKGKNYQIFSNIKTKTKFVGKSLQTDHQFKTYIDLNDERYEITYPTVSAMNIIIGTTYLDIGGTS